MRASLQRDLILDIVNNNYTHLTVEEIYNLSKKEISNISLGTVYRNLNQLCDNGLIRRIKCDNNIDRFDNIKKKHSHFICNKCAKIEDVFFEFEIDNKTFNNALVTDYDLVFKGVCSECQKKED